MASKFSQLFPALVECFVIILFGYIAGRINIVSRTQAAGIGNYVKNFALPALLFKNMIELNFGIVSWEFIVAVFISKLIVFVIVFILTIILVRPHRLAKGALYSIFATQSNDFALGYPIVQAIYYESHPELLQYIYLLAPVSLLILNPIGFILLEVDKSIKSKKINNHNEDFLSDEDIESSEDVDVLDIKPISRCKKCFNIAKGVLLNPIVFMVFIGLAGHFVFKGKVPTLINPFLTTLSQSFSASALFYLGLTMVGKISNQRGIGLIIPASLITAKIILLPIIIREIVLYLGAVWPGMSSATNSSLTSLDTLADFGYLYGTFPTAPTVVIYAAQYGMEVDRLASGMVFCTSLSAPIMYISAWTLSMTSMSSQFFTNELKIINEDVSIVSIFCSVWCIVIFILGKKYVRVPHFITFALIINIFFAALATVLWSSCITVRSSEPAKAILFALMYYGVKSSRLMTASLALGLLYTVKKGKLWVWKKWLLFVSIPNILSAVITIIVISCGHSTKEMKSPVFQYGDVQEIASFIIILLSFLITGITMLIIARHSHSEEPSDNCSSDTMSSCDDEEDDHLPLLKSEQLSNISDKPSTCIGDCDNVIYRKFGDVQKVRHIVLLLLLMLSMLVGMFVVGWRLMKMKEKGVFFELSFLDAALSFGQAFLVFCVFGLDSELIIDPFVRAWRKCLYGSADIALKPLEDVDQESLKRCWQFTKFYLDQCKLDIVQDIRKGVTIYKDVFYGDDLCMWLQDHGLCCDPGEAVLYGESLMLGRVLHHFKNKHYFYNKNFIYKFSEKKSYVKVAKPKKHTLTPYKKIFPNKKRLNPENLLTPKKFFGYGFEAYYSESECNSRSYQSSPLHCHPCSSGNNNSNKMQQKENSKTCAIMTKRHALNENYSDSFSD